MFHVATKLPFTDGDPQQVSQGHMSTLSPRCSALIPHARRLPSSFSRAATKEETHW